MESMEFDPETLLASGSSDPMLGNPAEQQAPTITHEQQAQPPPSGSFIVLQSGGSPGGGPGGVTQLGNISVSSLAPGQGARAATSRLTAVMGRAAGSAPGNLTKFIISPGQATSSAAPVRLLSGATNVRVATPANAPPAVSAAGPGTLTLTSAQAQQMGLISPRKMTTMDGSRPGPSPKRIVIRSSPGQQAKRLHAFQQGGVAAAGSVQPAYRILSQSGLQQTVTAGRGQQGVQFVRVVGSVAGQPAFSNPSIVTNTTAAASANAAVKIAIASGGRLAPPQSAQRLLLPAAPSGGTVLASAGGTGAGMEMLRTVPATGYSRPRPSPQLPRLGRPPNPAVPSRPPQQAQKATAHVARSSRVGGESVPQIRPRKPCNCTKSQCLKLYCDCFASGEFCNNCNCTNCFNSLDREEERQRAIRACLDRNPFAFKPKIGKSDNETRKHQKGCNCKKSGCLKNYCECYEAKIFCSSQCKCMGCKNHESANSSRQSRPGAAGATAMEDPLSLLPSDPGPSTGRGGRRPGGLKVATFPVTERASAAVRVTQDVIDATLSCLMTEAAAAAGTEEAQRRVLREFGRCLSEIIDYGSRRAAEASVPGMV